MRDEDELRFESLDDDDDGTDWLDGDDPEEEYRAEEEEDWEETEKHPSTGPFLFVILALAAAAAFLTGFVLYQNRDSILSGLSGQESTVASESAALVQTITGEDAALAASQKQAVKETADDASAATDSTQETTEIRSDVDTVLDATDGEVTFTFAGDILFDTSYAAGDYIAGLGITNLFDETALSLMTDADVFCLNNEFPYTTSGTPLEDKKYTFHADPSSVTNLDAIGCDLVTLANNHTFDYGEQGLLDTLDTLEADGMAYIGAGRNLDEASAPATYQAGNTTIAILNATQIERYDNPESRGATETESGVFRCYDPTNLYAAIAKAKETYDLVFVYVHWGTEGESEPDEMQVSQAQGMEEAGADLVIGDHPHVLQGFTQVNGMPVLYSLGNYVFHNKTQDTGLLSVTIDTDGKSILEVKFIPMTVSNCRVTTAADAEKTRILNDMQQLSSGVTIDADGVVTW